MNHTEGPKPTWFRRKNVQLLMLLLLFGLPPLVALHWYHHQPTTRHTINQGKLLKPPLNVAQLHVATLVGEKLPTHHQHRWQLVWYQEGGCDKTCAHQLYAMRQVWIASGKHQVSVQPSLWLAGKQRPSNTDAHKLSLTQPGLPLRWVRPNTLGRYVTTKHRGQLFVADPSGWLVLTYPSSDWLRHVHHDLKRLMKVNG